MSYLKTREPLPRRQLWLAVAAILLMISVVLEATHVISLGKWRVAPFVILLIGSFITAGRPSRTTKT